MKFNKKYKTIFLDINSDYFELNSPISAEREKVNVILSPSLYWVKKLSLPVKYIREVNKLLPSIFEDTLPAGNYSYSAYKKGEEFFVFAYEDKLILDTMTKKGIVPSSVVNVYFAQSEFENFENALQINENQSIYIKDDILVLVPSIWMQVSETLDLSTITPSKHKIVLQQFGHIVDRKSLYKIGAILLVLVLLVASEYYITSNKAANILTLKDELFAKNNLQSTMFQNESMLKKYTDIHEKQTKLREYSSNILSIRLQGDTKLSLLSYKETTLNADFSEVDKQQESNIVNVLKSKNMKFKSTLKENVLHLEIVL